MDHQKDLTISYCFKDSGKTENIFPEDLNNRKPGFCSANSSRKSSLIALDDLAEKVCG